MGSDIREVGVWWRCLGSGGGIRGVVEVSGCWRSGIRVVAEVSGGWWRYLGVWGVVSGSRGVVEVSGKCGGVVEVSGVWWRNQGCGGGIRVVVEVSGCGLSGT
ncbi:hypothetical protein Pcinc_040258 [Petrolisthes cinctipes]|uniref:Uncharacterized protein n=1 Tax=Petrolisthes cinctipes TaxID=88211 RepID=A0AAE1BN29_PETCI|nr:hypothetical protein Pcinc_040258 [Petrolisthes cinctipes]